MHSHLPEPDDEERAHAERLAEHLREEIAAQGPMPFSRFMERCLYAPGLGYYSAGKPKFGAAGDFVTAPELGDLFAQCVAHTLAPALRELGPQAEMIELGGGSGAFAEAAIKALDAAGAMPYRYRILEPSADLRERQGERLRAALPPKLHARVAWLERPPEQAWRGVLFANEVIDALPATRFTLHEGEVFEEHVEADEAGRFQRSARPADPLVAGAVRHLERALGGRFAEGYRSELLPQLPYWMQAVAGTLEAGLMLFVDYGYPRAEYYHSERTDGTLRAFYRQRMHADVLRYPGLQDLTASVDFTALAEAGVQAGFEMAAYLPQAQFLIASGLQEAFQAAHAQAADEQTRYALAQEVKHLTLPGEMGERFQVMLFTRGLQADVLPEDVRLADRSQRL
ncbi:class I SAM-dependent methyltransferase [Oleiagrimonas citrea]|uniref:Class I SAM-dependent methyltransferase n=1 Tax=Oleiagrimonas citrea TaxID=1665687 RepID=A0A846ZLF5_9GAMM|nr:SAM-dependent methyltransferase [Oleiagrimonas citrea]NKZ38507.1 class I SAM-dependent methyltransferase [Oleiagrimonas citrea]